MGASTQGDGLLWAGVQVTSLQEQRGTGGGLYKFFRNFSFPSEVGGGWQWQSGLGGGWKWEMWKTNSLGHVQGHRHRAGRGKAGFSS
jgi:hypothetical protein